VNKPLEIQNIPVELPLVPTPREQDEPLPSPPPPPPEEPIDPSSHTLTQILEIIPDIDPKHAWKNIFPLSMI